MKVRVYRNLHQKCFSVKCKKTNLVIAHVSEIFLEDVTFPVSEKQRQRVLESGRKNVHAYVEGTITLPKNIDKNKLISYNPRKEGYFFYKSNGREVKQVAFADVSFEGIFVAR